MILFEIHIKDEKDIVIARQRAREAAKNMKFSITDQTRIITAVSELSRNIYEYASTGTVTIEIVSNSTKRGLMISFHDEGPGIPDVEKALSEGYTTGKGMGLGLPGSKRLMDDFSITSQPGKGTKIIIKKWL
ncbi:anti-sigma regulatory factor [Petroclostridium sp. X23]|uniref:anti-sigma regulatory factor n=1 Tax=Petroclostridium sp. X23 TaxID=3045146 RepID=UPI0024ACF81C|nr:anti-sigma regulatory factor [Petroclostridium sp. X23]WHH61368.1 anti-sigma regulatory factor [Petroclostridium sp. X23]